MGRTPVGYIRQKMTLPDQYPAEEPAQACCQENENNLIIQLHKKRKSVWDSLYRESLYKIVCMGIACKEKVCNEVFI